MAGMTLQEAIDFASGSSYEKQYGTMTEFTVSMHEDSGTVLVGSALFETYGPDGADGGQPTFHPDLPLLDWGPARIDLGLARVTTIWSKPSVPGFSTRGQGGMQLSVAAGASAAPIPIDLSVRRDPGLRYLSFMGLGPSVQIEIEKLSAPGGTAASGVTLKAVEDGALLRAVGPSIRDPANKASYTLTLWIAGRPG